MPDGAHGWLGRIGVSAQRRIALWAEAAAGAILAEQDRWVLWVPVLFGAGAAIYLSLRIEPPGQAALALPAALSICAVTFSGRPRLRLLALILLIVSSGFAAGKLRTEAVRAPILPEDSRAYDVSGWIEERERRGPRESRITLRVISIGEEGQAAPFRVRVTVRGMQGGDFGVGKAVSVRAVLRAPPGPVLPGGFDYARKAYFERLGGLGFAIGPVEALAGPPEAPVSILLWLPIERLRSGIAQRIRAAVPGEAGDIANALITGDRAGISEESTEALRDSGLYHVISISGLHMVVMAGTLFWLVRALLALNSSLATRYPIKKFASLAALAGALFYLALSGGSVPTQRAWIMISIALVAILLDRPAISQRMVAVSALAILVFRPESVTDVSFQMSFAAVIALVAFFEWLRDRRTENDMPPQNASLRALRRAFLFFAGAALTTIIAGAAVAPFSIHHFQNVQHYSVVANVLACPIITLLIMPAALLSLIVMPLSLEQFPLQAMAYGIEMMLDIARAVSAWPGATSTVPRTPILALVTIAIGGLWLCLWRSRIRWAGAGVIACGAGLSGFAFHPDILVDRDGRVVAARMSDGLLAPTPVRTSNYALARWLQWDGDGRGIEQAVDDASEARRCDERACLLKASGGRVSLVRRAAALQDDCRDADIVVAPFPIALDCDAAVVIDSRALESNGAHALYIKRGGYYVETAAELRGSRPWVPAKPPARRRATSDGNAITEPTTHGPSAGGFAESKPIRAGVSNLR